MTLSAFFVFFLAGWRAAFFAAFLVTFFTDFFAVFFAAALVGLAFAAARAGLAFAAAGFPAVFFFFRMTFLAAFARDAFGFFLADAARVVFPVAFFLAITRPLRSPRPRTCVAQAH
ncbi:MAG: hypothetical protein ACYTGF_05020 [Planctomycetota bacterium]